MYKKILAIEASTRENSATNLALERLLNDYNDSEVRKYRLKDLALPLFIDERENRNWVKSDKLELLLEEMVWSDLIILASPLYWYAASHLMKNYLDHWTYYLRHDHHPLKTVMKNKEFEFLVVGHGEKSELTESVFRIFKQSVEFIGAQTVGEHYFSEQSIRELL